MQPTSSLACSSSACLVVEDLAKTFTLHNQGGIQLPVLQDVSLTASAGECLVLDGPSGTGKSTLLRCVYGNYLASAGSIRVHHEGDWLELTQATPRDILHLRRHTLGYVSQFLRVIPRVAALDIVSEPLRLQGTPASAARDAAAHLLQRLHLPERLWHLPPATFSGGEQQRVNIARGFIGGHPILLLDEPTASLDAENCQAVVELIQQSVQHGRCLIGIFHDAAVRHAVATRLLALRPIQHEPA